MNDNFSEVEDIVNKMIEAESRRYIEAEQRKMKEEVNRHLDKALGENRPSLVETLEELVQVARQREHDLKQIAKRVGTEQICAEFISYFNDLKRRVGVVVEPIESPDYEDQSSDLEVPDHKRSRLEKTVLYIPPGIEDMFWIPYSSTATFRGRLVALAEQVPRYKCYPEMKYLFGQVSSSNFYICRFALPRGHDNSWILLVYWLPHTGEVDVLDKPGKQFFDRLSQKTIPFLVGWNKKVFEKNKELLTPDKEAGHFEVVDTVEFTRDKENRIAPLQNLLLSVKPTVVFEQENWQSRKAEILSAVSADQPVVVRGFASDWTCIKSFKRESKAYLSEIGDAEQREKHRRYQTFNAAAFTEGNGKVIDLTSRGPQSVKATLKEFLSSQEGPAFLIGCHEDKLNITPAVRHRKDSPNIELPLVRDTPSEIPLLADVVALFPGAMLESQFFLSRGEGSCNLHFDDNSLFYVQCTGSRSFYIYPRQYNKFLVDPTKQEANGSKWLPQVWRADCKNADNYACAGTMKFVPLTVIKLNPGDLLLLPARWWHAVEAIPDSDSNCSCAVSWAIKPCHIEKLRQTETDMYVEANQFESLIKEGSRQTKIPVYKTLKASNFIGTDNDWDLYWSIAKERFPQEKLTQLRAQWNTLSSV
jgi:hypothetical protein